MDLAAAQRLFAPERTYLNTASYGLPPLPAFEAYAAAAAEWRGGRTGFDGWDRSVGAARATFARLAGVAEADVAIGAAVSAFVGLVAVRRSPTSTARSSCSHAPELKPDADRSRRHGSGNGATGMP